jgi:hypothetical protein
MAIRAGNARDRGSVRALERGLAVLAAMNRHKIASVLELARETRLPRPTVYRLLETLGRAGYVTRAGSADRFCLARQVRTLSDGFVEDEWISDIAAPLMGAFTQQHVWPVALMTFEEGSMLIRETTHPASSLSIDYGWSAAACRFYARQQAACIWLFARTTNGARFSICSIIQPRLKTGSMRVASQRCCVASASLAMRCRIGRSTPRPPAFRFPSKEVAYWAACR